MNIHRILSLGATLGLLSITPALAQNDALAPGDWQISCVQGACLATRPMMQVDQSTTPEGAKKQALAALVVGVKTDGTGILGAVLPLGAAIKPGTRMIFAGETVNAPIEVCLPDGCRSVAEQTPAQFDALRMADKVELQFFAQNNTRQISVKFPTTGLAGVIDTLRDKVKTGTP